MSVLLLTLFLVVVQVGLVLHTRTVLAAAAAEGARFGAAADESPDEAAQHTHDVVARALSRRVADRMQYGGKRVLVGGAPAVEVTVTGPLPVVLVPVGGLRITVRGHALEEQWP